MYVLRKVTQFQLQFPSFLPSTFFSVCPFHLLVLLLLLLLWVVSNIHSTPSIMYQETLHSTFPLIAQHPGIVITIIQMEMDLQ